MNIHEIDWRKSALKKILLALSKGLIAHIKQFSESDDVDDALEYEDNLCGIAFVAAQVYITGVVADFKDLHRKVSHITKNELLKTANPIVADTRLTRIQLCDMIANYYKHHDEWSNWTDQKALRTTDLLKTAKLTNIYVLLLLRY